MLNRVQQAFCGLHGHDNLLRFERERMFLECVSCGYESPGWAVKESTPVPSVDAEEQPALVRHQLIGERRVA
ncbi:MAG: hypothetical protein ACM3SQ_06240 [Betaproteobacteria bacterium]